MPLGQAVIQSPLKWLPEFSQDDPDQYVSAIGLPLSQLAGMTDPASFPSGENSL